MTPNVPAALRSCPEAPAIPQGEYTQRAVADYIVRLWGAYETCRANLAAVDRLLDEFEE